MREIRFRGLDFKGIWRYGTYYYGVVYPDSVRSHQIDDCNIDENTIGQFTELKDKNGKEIYEGDVIEVNMGMASGGYNSIGEYEPPHEIKYQRTVAWHDDYAKFDWVGNPSGSILCKNNCKYFEVIGNIHQTP